MKLSSKARALISCLAVTSALVCNAFAAMEVPTDTIVQNLNGSQQVIKVYTIAPGTDPETLIEDPFVLEGYQYTYSGMVKEENRVQDTTTKTETVTVETGKKDLAVVLEQLAPTMEYDDGEYTGTLALDHTTIQTEAAGYASGSSSVSTVKTIGPVDRNDMSYVPATAIKDGRTLSLANVEWQVIGTDLVGEALVPSAYQAVATYSGRSSYQYATGYVTTADYVGEVTHDDVESVTYEVTYLGEEFDANAGKTVFSRVGEALRNHLPLVVALSGLTVLIVVGICLFLAHRKKKLEDESLDADYVEENDREEE